MFIIPVLVTHLRNLLGYCFVFLLLSPGIVAAIDVVHHDISVTLSPDKHTLFVKDTITLPDVLINKGSVEFYLHANLSPSVSTQGVRLNREKFKSKQSPVPLERFTLLFSEEALSATPESTKTKSTRTITLTYQGEIHHPVEQLDAEYARRVGVSPGIISQDGVFLSGSSYWYPRFGDELQTFKIRVILPEEWSSVSQGQRQGNTKNVAKNAGKKTSMWVIDKPQDEIYLIAAKFNEYKQASGAVESMVFLRQADDQLAQKYLDATAQYIEMYRKLLGPYPYSKFALVENFWETGYGMPSFTLLGPKVIRFPFILHSSYPHEILHNWWGNGVFVDYETGNWSEGLTSYLADHLIKEQRGQAANYRRNALQKYTDFVNASRDFPLTEFRSRHSATTEAVGYGKTLMFFHMLRQQLGDQQFIRALQTFYRQYKFKYAAFADVRDVFEQVTELDLATTFKQWVERTGAPELRVSDAQAKKTEKGFLLTAMIEQIQKGDPYELRLPISISIDGQNTAHQVTELVKTKRHTFTLTLQDRPVRLDIDPEFDVFRRLDSNEIPPALTKVFGAERVLIVLPMDAQENVKQAYKALATDWQKGQQGQITVKFDSELKKLPKDRAIWLFGWENRFRESIESALSDYEIEFSGNRLSVEKTELNRKDNAIVLTARNPANPEYAMTWLSNENITAMPGLGRKLPHYGRYSFLGFEGDEPTNMAKGQWPVVKSPMSILVKQFNNKQSDNKLAVNKEYAVPTVKFAQRRALAQLPPVFSEKRMLKDIEVLASEKANGRGLGSPELNTIADYIANEFADAGLQKGGDNGSYFQTWNEDVGEPVGKTRLKNVIGILPGSKAQWKGQSLVVAAHYDHLGRGWPDVHKGDEGEIHNGADDNASGVAVMLELIRNIAKNGLPERTIIFIAFTGEEAGRLGSLHFIKHTKNYPVEKMIAMLNLDTVGRLGENKLTVFGTGTASEWVHIFRGTGFVTGIDIQSVKNDFGSSDQRSFLDAGVPAVQFFSGVNKDFHRPTDTLDKIDSAGLVKVATVLKEAVEYLATREQPLTSTLSKKDSIQSKSTKNPAPGKGRKVSLGTVPDFAYEGNGVRITDVTNGSPAQTAGLKEGDVIIRLNKVEISDLRVFSAELRSLKPGDQITIVYVRDGKNMTATTQVISR